MTRAYVVATTNVALDAQDNIILMLNVHYMDNVANTEFGETITVTFASTASPNQIEIAITNAIIDFGPVINIPVVANSIIMPSMQRGHLI